MSKRLQGISGNVYLKDLFLDLCSLLSTSTTWWSRFPTAAKLISLQMMLHQLYRIIHTPNDYDTLQSDINRVSSCLTSKYLSLNSNKCCCLLLSCKRSLSIPLLTLTLVVAPLTQVRSYKYLGVLITSNLMPTLSDELQPCSDLDCKSHQPTY